MSEMRAKMSVHNVEEIRVGGDGDKVSEDLTFGAVCSSGFDDEGKDENNSYALWTPSAQLSMTVNNPALWGKFKAGDEFYLDFTKAD